MPIRSFTNFVLGAEQGLQALDVALCWQLW